MEDKDFFKRTTLGILTSVMNVYSPKNNNSATVSEVNDKTELEADSQEEHSDTNGYNLEEIEEARKTLNIQPRDFDKHKKNLQETIKSIDKSEINIGISNYELKWYGLRHRKDKDKVTFYDINGLTSDIIEVFEKVQERELKMLKEFQTVFNTIDSLDKEYIGAILINIAAIEKTNKELQITNEDLKQTIEKQGLTISKLVSFKEKINDLASESQKHEEQLLSLLDFKEQQEANQNKVEKKLEKQEQTISKLVGFKDEINALMADSQKHEEQLASLLDFKEQQETNQNKVEKKLEKQEQTLSKLVSFKEKINDLASESQKHEEQLLSLLDFKEQLEANQNKIEKKLEELSEHNNIFDALLNTKLQESFDKISEIEKKTSKKIKRAYLLAIMSILFAVATFFISPFNKMTKSMPTQEITSIPNNDLNNRDSNISSDTNDSLNNNFDYK